MIELSYPVLALLVFADVLLLGAAYYHGKAVVHRENARVMKAAAEWLCANRESPSP